MNNWTFLFLGLILAYLLEFTRPWVKSYFEKRSLSIRERRIFILVGRYRYIKSLREVPFMINYSIFRYLAWSLSSVTFVIAIIGVFVIFPLSDIAGESKNAFMPFVIQAMVILFSWFSLYALTQITETIDDLIKFDRYREKTIAKLRKLGGNPEDLDKEE